MDIDAVTEKVQAFFSEVLAEKNRPRYHHGLWQSYGHVATPAGARRRVRFVFDLCELAHFSPEGKVILDAGCGYGVIATILALMGANKVIGVDISEERLPTFARIIEDYQMGDRLEAHLLRTATMRPILSAGATPRRYGSASKTAPLARCMDTC